MHAPKNRDLFEPNREKSDLNGSHKKPCDLKGILKH